jgi:hypothetical protein
VIDALAVQQSVNALLKSLPQLTSRLSPDIHPGKQDSLL